MDALRRGAIDYLTKPVDFARIKMALANVTRTLEMKGEIGTLRSELRKLGRFGPLIGTSPAMQTVYDLIGRVARTDASVLITGETGTGKDVVALTIHSLSRRSKEAFLPVNCGAISANLIESELFGHERGSFTGADRLHKGYFERAHRGTLFLDEITEMPLELQVRLLRVLETATVTRVGGSEPIKVDVRILAATSLRVEEAVAASKLREDLFYRLNVFPIALPPLRERGEDVELLAEQCLGELNAASGTAKHFTRACLETAPPTQLARKRARAEERHTARVHPGRGGRGRRLPPARRHRGGARFERRDAGGDSHRGDGAALHPGDSRSV